MRSSRLRLLLALVSAAVIAEVAVVVMRPRHGIIKPDPVSERDYFNSGEVARAKDFRYGQLGLYLVEIALQGGVLLLMVARPGTLERFSGRVGGKRPSLAMAAAGAGLAVTLHAVALPAAAAAHERAVDYGLSIQGWAGWFGDQAKTVGIAALLTGLGAAAFGLIARRFPRRWWLVAAALTMALEAFFVLLAPVLLAPLFNRFTPLPEGRERQEIMRLAQRAGVNVGQVYEVDASRRTTTKNAYVAGLGPTKRVVLYDTLLRDFSPTEVRLVVAHELGHVTHRDMPKGLLFVFLVTPGAMFAVKYLTEWLAARSGRRPGTVGSLPALALSFALVAFTGQVVGNQLSRDVEARADSFALELTDEPKAAISMERRLALANLVDPEPPRPIVWLLATHPPTVKRIGTAVAYERESGQ